MDAAELSPYLQACSEKFWPVFFLSWLEDRSNDMRSAMVKSITY